MQEDKDGRAAKRFIRNGEKEKRFGHEEGVDPAAGGVSVKEVEPRGSIKTAGGERREVADAASCGRGAVAGGEELHEDGGVAGDRDVEDVTGIGFGGHPIAGDWKCGSRRS